jgi:hypothetical protein
MDKRLITCLIFILYAGVEIHAQNYITVSGTVTDKETNEPLGSASVFISGEGMGTITNDLGQFELKVPDKFMSDTLIVSFLGYKKHHSPISQLKEHENVKVTLIPEATVLDAVSVAATRSDANQIIAKAIAAIKINYPSDPFIAEGFYRNVLRQDQRFVALSEAALRVYDKSFQRKLNHGITEDVIVIEARNTINYADPLVYGVRKQNEIMDLLDNNPVHYPRGLLNAKYFKYAIDSVFQMGENVVYVIATIPMNHLIYVADESFAIIKTVERISETDTLKRPEFNLNDSLIVRRMVYFEAVSEFQEYNGKWYVKYSSETDAFEILNKRSRKRKFLVDSYKEFVVTNLIDSNVSPFSKKETYDFKNDVTDKEYNAAFWEKYSTIQLSPLNPKVRKDLEREVSLKDQFQRKK